MVTSRSVPMLREGVVVKTLAGFLNGKGGTLLIGVDDAGGAVGIAADYRTLRKQDRDGFELHLQQLVTRDLGEAASASFLTVNFHEIDGEDICQIAIEPCDHPIYVDSEKQAVFYLRTGNATRPLPVDEAVKYVQHRWGGSAFDRRTSSSYSGSSNEELAHRASVNR